MITNSESYLSMRLSLGDELSGGIASADLD